MYLVRFSCGCVGFPPIPSTGEAVIVEFCDGDGDEYGCSKRRGMDEKPYAAIHDFERDKIILDLASLIADGYNLRQVKQILK